MHVFIHSYNDPQLNLAYEEWLFEHFTDELLRLWINPKSVVIGKHQNTIREANVLHCINQKTPILRRISGGGTVYHDLGNINFSFFRTVDKEKMIDYDRNLQLIQEALQSCGFPVTMNARHDLYLDRFKVSGNAQHLRKNKALHHGTILYDADLNEAQASLKRTSGEIIDKSVQSVRSPITNLRLSNDLGNPNEFLRKLHIKLLKKGLISHQPPLPSDGELDKRVTQRYIQEAWNFGYSPRYVFKNETEIGSVKLDVDRGGCIHRAELNSDTVLLNSKDLIGLFHHPQELQRWLLEKQLTSDQILVYLKLLFG